MAFHRPQSRSAKYESPLGVTDSFDRNHRDVKKTKMADALLSCDRNHRLDTSRNLAIPSAKITLLADSAGDGVRGACIHAIHYSQRGTTTRNEEPSPGLE